AASGPRRTRSRASSRSAPSSRTSAPPNAAPAPSASPRGAAAGVASAFLSAAGRRAGPSSNRADANHMPAPGGPGVSSLRAASPLELPFVPHQCPGGFALDASFHVMVGRWEAATTIMRSYCQGGGYSPFAPSTRLRGASTSLAVPDRGATFPQRRHPPNNGWGSADWVRVLDRP